jgi:uncharacterized protein YprB with RNaseH-like and TPR domain
MKTAYLDIETNYVGKFTDQRLFRDCKNHKITVIGIRILDGVNELFIQLVGKDATRAALLQALEGVERIVTYNDFPVIAAQLGVVLDKEFPHVDLCPECWRKGLWGGQKVVEQSLGLKRKLPGKDGKWADETWKQYEVTQDERCKNEVLAYNQEDVLMLRCIEEAIEKR